MKIDNFCTKLYNVYVFEFVFFEKQEENEIIYNIPQRNWEEKKKTLFFTTKTYILFISD